MFDGTGDPKVHLRTYCDKPVGIGKDERIRMKLFMKSLTRDALSWYISQNPKKWINWVSMASDFIDRFRFNMENAPDVFYIQNLKKKPSDTFREYATRWRSEAAKVRPALEEEQMNKFFENYERLRIIENHKFSDIIKLGERIEEGIKSEMLYERLKAIGYVTPIPVVAMENYSPWVNPNKTRAYHSGMKGHTIDECRTLKDKIQTLIDTKVIQAKETSPNVRNNPLPEQRGEGVNVIETDKEWDPEGSIGLIREEDDPKIPPVTLTPIVVQIQSPIEVEVAAPTPFEVEVTMPSATPTLFEVEVTTPFTVMVVRTPSFNSNVVPWDYTAEARRKGKGEMEETGVAQVREYSVVDPLNKTPAQISILSLLQNSEAHRNALMKVLNEAYVPNNITSGEMANMVGQVLESHMITFHKEELPPEGLSHNRALHITVQCEDKFIVRVLIDGGSSLNICPLTTLKRLGKGLHEI
ncbi:uncharacterized protein [Nicotiana tomentosiformis]|uniref:uncharacterized protein n=1 Tax=Nicotiana tomentosiformis TaxID=4098 RepID=UPI00388CB071